MIKIYKTISTVKAKEPKDNQPTHYLVAKENKESEQKEFVASLWAKSGEKDGVKYNFLSGEMSKKFDGEKPREGFVIVKVSELEKVLKLAEAMEQKLRSPLGDGYPTEVEQGVPVVSNIELNPEDIPF